MEQQFILRLPEILKNVNPKECKLVKTAQKEVSFIVGDKTYPGIVCRLPTIVESQKVLDNRLYKIADISTLVVIYEDKGFNMEEEIFKHESSGLTPPMFYAKERRFAKTVVRTEDVEKIEKRVAELLKADLKAQKVEIITSETEGIETEIDILAAEIENELLGTPIIKTNESTIRSVSEPAIPEQSVVDYSSMKMEPSILEQPVSVVEVPVKKSPELLELEVKIKEKEEQFEKAANPILKKRFEQALEALKAEHKKRMENGG